MDFAKSKILILEKKQWLKETTYRMTEKFDGDGLMFITPIVKLISVDINFPDTSVFPRELKSKWHS